jgi:16S rRNA (adenine1518-N6/adenine1519-N6)-dimethyltransferase
MRPRRRFGQHFLQPAWIERVVAAIAPQPSDQIIEIGPGTGALTFALAPRVETIVAVELDRDLAAHLAPRKPVNVNLVQGDFLRTDLEKLRAGLRHSPRSLRVVGNLPYNVASPILFRLLGDERALQPYSDATLMVQREVADRLVAQPGSKAYGVMTILVRLRADVSRLLSLPPGAFRPAPAVSSAVVRLRFRPPPVPLPDETLLTHLVQTVFNQRRKTLANALRPFAAAFPEATDPVARAGLDPRQRPETMDLADFARLADVFIQRRGPESA